MQEAELLTESHARSTQLNEVEKLGVAHLEDVELGSKVMLNLSS